MNQTISIEKSDALKVLGLLTMVIDHIGKIICPDIIEFQVVGRLCFPLFAYALVLGFINTSNFKTYLLRILFFGAISQPIFSLIFDSAILNIFFTLALGLLSLYALKINSWILYTLTLAVSLLDYCEYGFQGIVLINLFYIFRNNRFLSILTISIHFVAQLFIDINTILYELVFNAKLQIHPAPSLDVFGVFSLVLIYAGIKLPIKVSRQFYYLFYPAHLLLLMAIAKLL